MIFRPMVVSCDLASPLAGDPPMIDALLSMRAALVRGKWREVSRQDAAPPLREVPIPIAVSEFGGWPIPHASSPIFTADSDIHEYYVQKFPMHCVEMLGPDHLQQINTTGGFTKSARLPNRVRLVKSVSWIVEGNWREMKKLLAGVDAIGKDSAMGYGVVSGWRSEERRDLVDAWWFAKNDGHTVLMRPMPLCDDVPGGMSGAMRSFGACCAPYWHPERYTEVWLPC